MGMLSFRPIARADFPMLSGWLRMPHVARWWDDDACLDAIEEDYGGCIDGSEPAEVFIVGQGGADIGLIQRFRMGAYPDYLNELAPLLAVRPDECSIDYLIGPPEFLGKGLGTDMIATFSHMTLQADPGSPSIVVPVHADNRASWRALARAGYLRAGQGELTPDNPADDRRHFIYRLARGSSLSASNAMTTPTA